MALTVTFNQSRSWKKLNQNVVLLFNNTDTSQHLPKTLKTGPCNRKCKRICRNFETTINIAMVVIRWKYPLRGGISGCYERIQKCMTMARLRLYLLVSQITFVFCCLTYNEHMNYSYTIDFLLEPIHWFVENFAKYLGKMFVFCVSVLTSAVVFIAYWLGVPYWWEQSQYMTIFLIVFGNWLLINIVFHYYMGVTTPPGYPPHSQHIIEAASLCKKCIAPKPQRTHHCSVCDRCILKMDHHCPWLNNCVGFYNARYFYLFMVYMLAGVTFIITAGAELGYSVMWINDTGGLIPNNDPDLVGHPVRINQSGALVPVNDIVEYDSFNSPREHDLPVPPVTEAQRICAHPWKRRAVFFMAYTCVAAFFALLTLIIMHGKNINRGETSVEAHINGKLRKTTRLFRNPYDFGRRKNWRLFLGLTHQRTFIRHVLLPSTHAPAGNGVVWHTVHNMLTLEEWP